MINSTDTKFSDIIGLSRAKEAIKLGLLCPLKMKRFFTDIRRPPKGILFYGLPGTGKTMLARAIASSQQTKFFIVKPSTFASRWKGDSENLVQILFEMARYYAPSTIFIDEIDSLLSARQSSDNDSVKKTKVQFFIEIDGIMSQQKEDQDVFILAATNRPWDLDEAILRRLEKRIYMPLPSGKSRKKLFENNLKHLRCCKKQ